ncbi:hypothetical protein BO85DRAFT_448725 [Aspergillus piperis CBS 112811]|uniref:Uncharacterized protein n=1 Tax=Aspergillus piperis CBS 112811 TaxID=1448313 RepID=A0A8G1VQF2_9EURO|nr:hypothetical protein BO85DRAFT_448725 [Aspergillus piperis CBS 112811]RAH58703.1 hypothetical protein BO85DRAFT_448725 [Aspergillus piperis CBS 112811]
MARRPSARPLELRRLNHPRAINTSRALNLGSNYPDSRGGACCTVSTQQMKLKAEPGNWYTPS